MLTVPKKLKKPLRKPLKKIEKTVMKRVFGSPRAFERGLAIWPPLAGDGVRVTWAAQNAVPVDTHQEARV